MVRGGLMITTLRFIHLFFHIGILLFITSDHDDDDGLGWNLTTTQTHTEQVENIHNNNITQFYAQESLTIRVRVYYNFFGIQRLMMIPWQYLRSHWKVISIFPVDNCWVVDFLIHFTTLLCAQDEAMWSYLYVYWQKGNVNYQGLFCCYYSLSCSIETTTSFDTLELSETLKKWLTGFWKKICRYLFIVAPLYSSLFSFSLRVIIQI